MEAVFSLISNKTGEILTELRQGDKIMRKASIDYLAETIILNDAEPFVKLYTKVFKVLTEENITSAELLILSICLDNLNYKSGVVKYKESNEYLTPANFIKETKLSEMTIHRCLNRLITLGVIGKLKVKKEYQLYVNPYIFMKGYRVNKTLMEMFSKTKWAKHVKR